jgi:hypothetical protein
MSLNDVRPESLDCSSTVPNGYDSYFYHTMFLMMDYLPVSSQDGWNRLSRIVLGIPSVGKTYLLKMIAVHAGLNFSNLFVVYLDCRSVELTPIYVLVGEIAKSPGNI